MIKKALDFFEKKVAGLAGHGCQKLEPARVAGQPRVAPRPASPKTAFAGPVTPP